MLIYNVIFSQFVFYLLDVEDQVCVNAFFCIDEEIGGVKGMQALTATQIFKDLNIGFALDEGLANPTQAFTLFYGERMPWCKFFCGATSTVLGSLQHNFLFAAVSRIVIQFMPLL